MPQNIKNKLASINEYLLNGEEEEATLVIKEICELARSPLTQVSILRDIIRCEQIELSLIGTVVDEALWIGNRFHPPEIYGLHKKGWAKRQGWKNYKGENRYFDIEYYEMRYNLFLDFVLKNPTFQEKYFDWVLNFSYSPKVSLLEDAISNSEIKEKILMQKRGGLEEKYLCNNLQRALTEHGIFYHEKPHLYEQQKVVMETKHLDLINPKNKEVFNKNLLNKIFFKKYLASSENRNEALKEMLFVDMAYNDRFHWLWMYFLNNADSRTMGFFISYVEENIKVGQYEEHTSSIIKNVPFLNGILRKQKHPLECL